MSPSRVGETSAPGLNSGAEAVAEEQGKKLAKALLVSFGALNKEVTRGHVPNFFLTL